MFVDDIGGPWLQGVDELQARRVTLGRVLGQGTLDGGPWVALRQSVEVGRFLQVLHGRSWRKFLPGALNGKRVPVSSSRAQAMARLYWSLRLLILPRKLSGAA